MRSPRRLTPAEWREIGDDVIEGVVYEGLCAEVGELHDDMSSYGESRLDDLDCVWLFMPDDYLDVYFWPSTEQPDWTPADSEARAFAAYLIAAMVEAGDA